MGDAPTGSARLELWCRRRPCLATSIPAGPTADLMSHASFITIASSRRRTDLNLVTMQLPEWDGEFEYRIRSPNEPHERIAWESELSGA
jgi:hypothetical protein